MALMVEVKLSIWFLTFQLSIINGFNGFSQIVNLILDLSFGYNF
jgi:hypothetical protein